MPMAGLCHHVGIVPSNEVITQAYCGTLDHIIQCKQWAIICERECEALKTPTVTLSSAAFERESPLLQNSLVSSHTQKNSHSHI